MKNWIHKTPAEHKSEAIEAKRKYEEQQKQKAKC